MSSFDAPRIDPDAALWSAPADVRAGRPLLVLLHGYGADEHDLFGLSPALPEAFVTASVRAPLTPPWPSPGHSWYPIEDVTDADLSGPRARDPERVTAAASAFLEWLDAAAGPASTVGLLGFSQGASVALQAMRLAPERFAFVLNLSGYTAPGELPGDAELQRRRPPVFWGRGALDDVIPAPLIDRTTQWLPAHSELSGRVYPTLGHGVSEEEVADIRVFLDKRLATLDADG
ncbi:alpha/beta hydrolase [Microbacterium elymi]|uniref:Alpha/beta hydrolase-fold protein n=1 Tax=Microbacterium elymi TaxID=2909587 RepID=A0ABY5NL97_9MICO|nr:alpha/beta fold hydrolase [Microbacterium elymi]UUT35961.1 alpha/beta hydrolase-fold protein [Microbacterium elymi]